MSEKTMSKQEASQAAGFPYTTHLNILFPHLEKFDIRTLAGAVTDQWYNQILCRVNGSVVRLASCRANITGTSMSTMMNSSFVSKGSF